MALSLSASLSAVSAACSWAAGPLLPAVRPGCSLELPGSFTEELFRAVSLFCIIVMGYPENVQRHEGPLMQTALQFIAGSLLVQ